MILGTMIGYMKFKKFSAQTLPPLVKIQLGTYIMVVLEVRKPVKIGERPEIGGPEANSWSFMVF